MRRLLAAAGLALLLIAGLPRPASAHPLGNYTVNRAVAVTIAPDRIAVQYVVDMAEIPAFGEVDSIDQDRDGAASDRERDRYAMRSCATALEQLELRIDARPVALTAVVAPRVELTPGAGGLPTLRLTCPFAAPRPPSGGGALTVIDHTDDGHVGWREVTIAGAAGVRIVQADVPERSASATLSAYPMGRLESPPDVRQGQATFAIDAGAPHLPAGTSPASGAGRRPADPLAALLAGELSPPVVALALLLAAGLGAAHAISPGHGKTLVAAYLVGSDGTTRQAVVLGLTVAFTHTAGVLVLGVLVLVAGEVLLPETLIGWLTIASGSLMALLGAGLLWQAVSRRRRAAHGRHAHAHPHAHGHDHAHGHGHAPATGRARLGLGNVAALGMAGGLVPSASALIVLLAAVTTGRLAFGLALIVAFGIGMALVLGGLAAATALARSWLARRTEGRGRLARVAADLLPVASGVLVLGIGLVITTTALLRIG
ncbi:MAG TPA: High-affinity nickel-transporter [Candidatus Limnocylindria bacterium]|nr:High-affinity nickel-transporter [Candidatus Limnocylindria bacterium]